MLKLVHCVYLICCVLIQTEELLGLPTTLEILLLNVRARFSISGLLRLFLDGNRLLFRRCLRSKLLTFEIASSFVL